MNHFEAFSAEACRCKYCLDYIETKQALKRVIDEMAVTPCSCIYCRKPTPGTLWSHSRGCNRTGCRVCIRAEAAHTKFTAASNRRDLWSEMSYHATHDTDLTAARQGAALMEWVEKELSAERPKGLTGFWAVIANRYSMAYWINIFETQVLATVMAVSGTF